MCTTTSSRFSGPPLSTPPFLVPSRHEVSTISLVPSPFLSTLLRSICHRFARTCAVYPFAWLGHLRPSSSLFAWVHEVQRRGCSVLPRVSNEISPSPKGVFSFSPPPLRSSLSSRHGHDDSWDGSRVEKRGPGRRKMVRAGSALTGTRSPTRWTGTGQGPGL